ncbi:hypothetical protein Ancab_035558, partial [Ancistrocladus abbreviatus]
MGQGREGGSSVGPELRGIKEVGSDEGFGGPQFMSRVSWAGLGYKNPLQQNTETREVNNTVSGNTRQTHYENSPVKLRSSGKKKKTKTANPKKKSKAKELQDTSEAQIKGSGETHRPSAAVPKGKITISGNQITLPLTFIFLCFLTPAYWAFKLLRFISNSLFSENVTGKVIVITGASSGIGEHLAYEYARRGASLVLSARRENRLKEVAKKAKNLGSPDVLVVPADVSKVDDCQRLVDKTINHYGR